MGKSLSVTENDQSANLKGIHSQWRWGSYRWPYRATYKC